MLLTDAPQYPDAECARPEHDPDWWFAEAGDQRTAARKLCLDVCPHAQECANGAKQRGEDFGMWGGLMASTLACTSYERVNALVQASQGRGRIVTLTTTRGRFAQAS